MEKLIQDVESRKMNVLAAAKVFCPTKKYLPKFLKYPNIKHLDEAIADLKFILTELNRLNNAQTE